MVFAFAIKSGIVGIPYPNERQAGRRGNNPGRGPSPGPKMLANFSNADFAASALHNRPNRHSHHLVKETLAIEIQCHNA